MQKTRLLIVGGFLGAGKTTLLLKAAQYLAGQNYRVGVVTNDQGQQLVDSAFLAGREIPIQEVAGGCFCCRFPDLLASLRQLRADVQPDVILAEPVGSCTDLVATVLRPILLRHADEFEVAPLTIVHDPQRAMDDFQSSVGYLYDRQLTEAEVIALSKSDLLDAAEGDAIRSRVQNLYRGADVISLSARTGDGVTTWADQMMTRTTQTTLSLDISYPTYAEAEASLGWLNTNFDLHGSETLSPTRWMTALLTMLGEAFAARHMAVAHLKLYVKTPLAAYKASLTQTGQPIVWDSDAQEALLEQATVILNARVSASPEQLRATVEQAIAETCARFNTLYATTHFECFSPLPPEPTFRLT